MQSSAPVFSTMRHACGINMPASHALLAGLLARWAGHAARGCHTGGATCCQLGNLLAACVRHYGLTQMLPMRLPTLACRYRGVSKKKGKWEAKVMVNRRWAYRELFDRCGASSAHCLQAARSIWKRYPVTCAAEFLNHQPALSVTLLPSHRAPRPRVAARKRRRGLMIVPSGG